jgi:UDP-2,3-diacylglucosamine pyrophosphatase LpxH
MKIALITDTHFGARGDSIAFAEYFNRFYYEFFFPYLADNGIRNIFHLGDIVDRRKYINFVTARHLRSFIDKCYTSGIRLDVIIGNHDTSFKNTNEVNAMRELYDHSKYEVNYYDEPTVVNLGDLDIAVLPWVCSGNYNESMEFLQNTSAQVLFGHLEIAGFEMYKGAVNDHGLSSSIFDKFDLVCSGHFHHKSTRGNINYLGAPYEMSWSDFDDPRGFHIFDTETRELQFIQNPYTMFQKWFYDDAKWNTFEHINGFNFEAAKGSYVKVIVKNKNNPFWFDTYIDRLEKAGALDIQVVEDNLNLQLEDDSDIVNEAEDTLTILTKVVDQWDTPVDKKRLYNFLTTLYGEALSVE